MELIHNLVLGFSVSLSFQNIAYCFAGAFVGTLIGVLPGIGTTATLAMLLPLTFGLPPVSALIMLAGIYYGAQYGGSTSAILVNLPGEASSVVTSLDGYELAKRGQAGSALATAALSSFFGGCVSIVLVAAAAPALSKVAIAFGPAEYFSLMVLGLVGAVILAQGSILKAFSMILLGILIGLVGTDTNTGVVRFSFGLVELHDGIGFVVVIMGLFGIGEVISGLEIRELRLLVATKVGSLWSGWGLLRRIAMPAVRGTALGSLLGLLPGGGAVMSSFAAYALEKRIAADSTRFGAGAIEGLAAPEAANNAAAQSSFIPLITLGLPANSVMALMLGAMTIHGIQPGPSAISNQPELFWGLITSMWIGNLILIVLNLPLIGIWVRLLTVPYHFLFPSIVLFCIVGVYSVEYQSLDMFMLAFFGFAGYLLSKLDCEPAPLLFGMILGPMLEQNLRRAMLMSRGDPAIFVERPVSAILLALAVGLVLVAAIPKIRQSREIVFDE